MQRTAYVTKTNTLNVFFSRTTTTLTLLDETLSDLVWSSADATNRNPTPVATVAIPYIKSTSETISRVLQPYNIRVAHKPTTMLRHLKTGTNPTIDREQFTRWNDPTARLPTLVRLAGTSAQDWLTTNEPPEMVMPTITLLCIINWQTPTLSGDSAQCLTCSTNYFQRLTLESWYTNVEQTPLKRCQQLLAPYKRLIHDENETDKRTSNRPTQFWLTTDGHQTKQFDKQKTDRNRPNCWWQT